MGLYQILIFQKETGNDASENAAGFVNLFLQAAETLSTTINVILYVFFNPSFKRAMVCVLKCKTQTQEETNEQSHIPVPGENGHSMTNPAFDSSSVLNS